MLLPVLLLAATAKPYRWIDELAQRKQKQPARMGLEGATRLLVIKTWITDQRQQKGSEPPDPQQEGAGALRILPGIAGARLQAGCPWKPEAQTHLGAGEALGR